MIRNLAEYSVIGRGNASEDTAAFLAAKVDLMSGAIQGIRLPAATLYLNQQIDINAPPNPITIIGEGRYATRIVTRVTDGSVGAKQYPLVIRNTIKGVLVQGIAFEVFDPVPVDNNNYQNPIVFCNVSNLVLQDFISENSRQFGVGIVDDVIAATDFRTATACDNIIIRNGVVINASQYGIQHFPKVLSNGFTLEDMTFINCGTDVQGNNNFEPAAVKAGQATRRTVLNNIDIVCAEKAVGLSIGNYEDFKARNISIRNPKKQAVSISASTHPNLVHREPATPGGPIPPPYLPAHGTLDVEFTAEHNVAEAGVRTAPFVTGQFGQHAKQSCVTASTINITLSGTPTIAGVLCSIGNRVLVTCQTNPAENGIWTVAAGNWSRATDFNDTSEVITGSCLMVTGGANRGGWILISADPHAVGTSQQNWQPFNPKGPRIKASVNGEVIKSSEYSGFVGSLQFQFGVDVANIEVDYDWTGGNTQAVTVSPAFPLAVVLFSNVNQGKAVNPHIKVNAFNPYNVKQSVFMTLWLQGQNGGDLEIKAQGGGNYVFRAEGNSGVINTRKLDVLDFNLTDDPAQSIVNVNGESGEYHFDSMVYRETTGIGNGDYWVLGAGVAPVFLYSLRSNVALLTSVSPLKIFQMYGRRGSENLSGGTANVSFGNLQEPDANYRISLAGTAPEVFRYASKTTSGFTIHSGNASSTAAVDWTISRDE